MAYEKRPRVRVGGLWEGKSGVLSGNLGGLRIVCFRNDKKRSANSPDFDMWFEEQEPKEGGQRGEAKQEPGAPHPGGDDETPF